jgi:hypothetical protein
MEKKSVKTIVLESSNETPEEAKHKIAFEDLNLTQDDLELVISETEKSYNKIDGVVIGKLVGFNEFGKPLVDYALNTRNKPLSARTTVILDKEKVGREVAFMFEDGDHEKPIIMGLIHQPEDPQPVIAEVDGERKTLTAKKEIVLRCGKASITLTRAGKIIIRGTYLLNRSSGVNKIKGGSVQIN